MKQFETMNNREQLGFTLIELSIVLVIIGLIVGGVLVGQDLIKAAEIRATVSQYEKYNSEVNTFRSKYNGIPGDIACGTAWNLGFQGGQSASCTGGMTGTAGQGDGNGLLEGGSSAAVIAKGETLVFWRDLSDANLIDGNFGASISTSSGSPGTDTTIPTVATYVPPAKAGRSNYWTVAADSGINYYLLTGFGTTPITTGGVYSFSGNLTPIESYNIDIKVDDGNPNTGIVQARSANAAAFAALSTTNAATFNTASTNNDCMMGGTAATDPTNIYNRNIASGGTSPSCLLRLRFN
jgi:prepilin-type N-terminal cleavage/methylation domain-containing protein